VERIHVVPVATEFGDFQLYSFEDHISSNVHTALVRGELDGKGVPLVRVHVQDTVGDVLGIQHPNLGWSLRAALRRIAREEQGVVVVLNYAESPRHLESVIRALDATKDELTDHHEGDAVLRTYGIGSQILRDLGITKMRVLSAPKQMNAISGFGLEIVEYVDDI
jgi:3,4-dihydroxy 2-butanone 4-phosphate synthase/GTP cyclohydrolase II